MKIRLVQANPVVGDIQFNASLIIKEVRLAYDNKIDLVVFSELFLTGYPPKDLLFYPEFMTQVSQGITFILSIRLSFQIWVFYLHIYD